MDGCGEVSLQFNSAAAPLAWIEVTATYGLGVWGTSERQCFDMLCNLIGK